mmetsp:Transcript_7937/g.21032  ORF Transcript_7937/g.21032 Transcript_7937/m.21032 type:complete len:374 (+) Transcript_7937:21-1142(+)
MGCFVAPGCAGARSAGSVRCGVRCARGKGRVGRRPPRVVARSEQNRPAETRCSAPQSRASLLSRRAITLLSSAGILETVYLGVQELRDPASSFCPTEACHTVLSSPYADVFGVPLSVLGLFAYCVCAYVNAYPALAAPSSPSRRRRELETREPLLAITSAMSVFSVYNVAVMLNVLHAVCQFCAFSAFLSFSLLCASVALVRSEHSSEPGLAEPTANPWRTAMSASAAAGLVAAAVFFSTDPADDSKFSVVASAASSNIELESSRAANVPPAITTDSGEYAERLAAHLEAQHARMYGAFWCSHCHDQKLRFGKQAFEHIEYIECDANGYNSQRALCRQKKVPGYPTWEIGGEFYPGERDLEDLAVLSEMDMEF